MSIPHSPRQLYHAPDRDALDSALLERLNKGDAEAFKAIFDIYATPLVLYARSLLGSTPAAEDTVHDLFTYVWTHRYTLEVSGALRTYLYKAVRNRVWKTFRSERVTRAFQERVSSVEPITSPTENADARHNEQELATAIERAVAALPERAREIWLLNRQSHLSYAEIAQVLNVSIKTVETHMGRALKAMRAALLDWRVS
jgi:RNA polymerase sigma-70 factor (ECF subfamily)